ncbi:MAG: DNA cytosine methyltransferase [Sphingobacteriales bacterium]|nr:MAG: DNA cytosine methyltransferase [Sphingobacteriales bacterium]
MSKLKLLDLYCCGGGAGWGYHFAGFEVTGVDIEAQPKYRAGKFIQGDAIEYLTANYNDFDVIHASPPCQRFSKSAQQWRKDGKDYPDLVEATRKALIDTGKPYIIENVEGAPLINPILLCGGMFEGLKMYRHRLFESNLEISAPPHPVHTHKQAKMGRKPKQGEYIQMVGHFSGVAMAQETTGLTWLGQYELAQCIPPQYTQHLGKQIIEYLSPQKYNQVA